MDKSIIVNIKNAARAIGRPLIVTCDNNIIFRDEGIDSKNFSSNSLVTWNDDAEICTCVRTNNQNYQHQLPVEFITTTYEMIQFLSVDINPEEIPSFLNAVSTNADSVDLIYKALTNQVKGFQHFKPTGDGINYKNTVPRGSAVSRSSNDVSPNATATIESPKTDQPAQPGPDDSDPGDNGDDDGGSDEPPVNYDAMPIDQLLGTPTTTNGNFTFENGIAEPIIEDGNLTFKNVNPNRVVIDRNGNLTFV